MGLSCPKGSVSRKAFSYRRKASGKRVHVRSSCVKSKGLRARGKRPKAILPPLKKGTLGKYGYKTKSSKHERRSSLKKAARSLGKNTVIRKLNAVSVLTRNTAPKTSKLLRSDMKFVQSMK